MNIDVVARTVAGEMARITVRDLWLLDLLREHRTLTTEHITTLGFLSAHRARKRLLLLHRRDVLDRWRYHVRPGSQSWRWTLGPLGAAILASRDDRPVPRPAVVRAATDRLAASGTITHLLGCHDFFVTLASYARTHPGHSLPRWWSEKRATAAVLSVARPDGHGVWVSGNAQVPFWLEYDTGSEGVRQVMDKLTGYARLIGTPWNFPILVWLPSAARHSTVHRSFARRVPSGLVVATAHRGPQQDPADPVWHVVGADGGVGRRLADIPVHAHANADVRHATVTDIV